MKKLKYFTETICVIVLEIIELRKEYRDYLKKKKGLWDNETKF